MRKYDFLIVGAGLFGSVFAYEAAKRNKRCLVVERRDGTGGNCRTEKTENIDVHKYGAHIFHTSDEEVWKYVSDLCPMRPFVNSPVANYRGELYNLPFNMNTFQALWGVRTPEEARNKLKEQTVKLNREPRNLEEKALATVGRDVYEKLIKGYTEKQWGRSASSLPPFIVGRLPVRFTFDNNYFTDKYQGIPENGYTALFGKLLKDSEVLLSADFLRCRKELCSLADKIVYTGRPDAFYDYRFGALEFRSLRFETEILNTDNHQGVAVMNYTDEQTPFTRIIEHKHFLPGCGNPGKTVISREYPVRASETAEPYYPVNDEKNDSLYKKYAALAAAEKDVYFGGRLAGYKYYDMDKTVKSALFLASRLL